LRFLVPATIALGIILRLRQFVFGRSLWLDEAMLALNFVDRSLIGVLKPLDNLQVAGPLFCVVEKLMLLLFGINEYALRLPSLLCGVTALFLVFRIVRRWLGPWAAWFALLLSATVEPLIYYSNECKQYSADVLVTLGLIHLFQNYRARTWTLSQAAGLGALGILAVWFAHPAVFVLPAVFCSLALEALFVRRFKQLKMLSLSGMMWMLGLLGLYMVQLRGAAGNGLQSDWAGSFAPFPPTSRTQLQWYVSTFWGIFAYPGGLAMTPLAALLSLIGVLAFWKRDRLALGVLLGPIFFALVASILRVYPFGPNRLLLFTVPAIFTMLAAGIFTLVPEPRPYSAVLRGLLMVLTASYPIRDARWNFVHPTEREDVRGVITCMRQSIRRGDRIAFHSDASSAWSFYADRMGMLPSKPFVFSTWYPDVNANATELDRITSNGRVWFVFSHSLYQPYRDFVRELSLRGKHVTEYIRPGAAAILYEFGPTVAAARRQTVVTD
jgi:hypothetical protein